jgi:hypothetical protein
MEGFYSVGVEQGMMMVAKIKLEDKRVEENR